MDQPPPPPTAADAPRLGVFDSGVGGLSVLRELQAQWPQARMLYLADSGNAPYGERSDEFVVERSLRITEFLLGRGAELIVVACNTATAAAVAALRARWPGVPVVGVEPAIKPAVKASKNRRVGVMATPSTLRSDKFQRLLEAHRGDAHVHLQPCPGLAALIEQGDLAAPALLNRIAELCQPLREAQVDTVVLGCTHYPFVRGPIQAAMGPEVLLMDTGPAVARQAQRLLAALPQRADAGVLPAGSTSRLPVSLHTTGDVALLRAVAGSWLGFPCEVSEASALR
jgi:glutamate racemase